MNKKSIVSANMVCIIFLIALPFFFYFNWFSSFSSSLWTYGDGEYSYFSYRKFLLESWTNGNFPFWNHYINLGFPFYADPQTEVLYPFNILYLFLPFNESFNLLMMLHFALAGLFSFIFLRSLKFTSYSSLLGAIAFMFCGAINTRRGHVSVEYTLIWLPLIFYFYERVKETHMLRYIALLSLASAMQFYAGFTQASFYSLIALGVYMLFSVASYESKKLWIKEVTLFTSLFIGLILIQLVPALITAVSVGRERVSYDIFASYSLPFRNLTALINPIYMGFEYPNTPFPLFSKAYTDAENLTEFSMYAGVFPLVLSIFSIFKFSKKEKVIVFWASLALFSLLFSLGGNIPLLYKIIYKIPGINSFRVPARMLFIFNFSLVVLFTYAVNQIQLLNITAKQLKPYFRFFLISFVFLTIYILASGRGQFNSAEIIIPGLLAITCVSLAEFGIPKLINGHFFSKSLIVFILCLDLWFFAFFNSNIFTKITPSNKLTQTIIELDPERKYRILSIAGIGGELSFDFLGRDRNMLTQIRSLIGHTSFIPKVFMEALRCDEAGTFYDYDYFLRNLDLIGSLNTKWVIINNTEKTNERYIKAKEKLKLTKTFENFDIFEIPDPQLAIFGLKNLKYSESNVIDGFKYSETGLIKDPSLEGNYSIPKDINSITIKNGVISANVNTDSNSFLAISETYSKNWKAFLNDTSIDVYKVNGLIMGVKIPSGNHTLTLKYIPYSFYVSSFFTAISVLIVILCILSSKSLLLAYRKKESL